MKKIITIAIAATVLSSSLSFAQNAEKNVRNNHSVSMPLCGLEYSFEHGLGGNWSLIERAGIHTYEFSMFSDWDTCNLNVNMLPAVTIEPRFYTSMSRRKALGRDTYNNSSDFVALPSTVFITGDGVELMFSPVYGIRRCGGKHWIHEFTFGTDVAIGEQVGITPHLQYRLGFTF